MTFVTQPIAEKAMLSQEEAFFCCIQPAEVKSLLVCLTDSIVESMDVSLNKLQEIVKHREAWHAAVYRVAESVGHDRVTEQ